MAGKLYIVGTPIGNLSDLSPRAVETLGKVDFIAAEDTRVTQKLLTHFSISKPMVSYHKFSGNKRGEDITARLLDGETCAIVTDAGMPCISDPGEELVRECHEHGVEIESVPGPSAAITALCMSGLDTSRFSFEGFLSVTKKQRDEHLDEIKDFSRTLIFYEAPHKLIYTLQDMLEVLGDRRIALCRELTKLHEEIVRTTLGGAVQRFQDGEPRGEFVLVVRGAEPAEQEEATLEDGLRLAQRLREQEGLSLRDSVKRAAKELHLSRNDLYDLAIRGE